MDLSYMISELKFVLPKTAFAPTPSLRAWGVCVDFVGVTHEESCLRAALFSWWWDDLTAAAGA
ncbi:MAG: hypothetical protein WCO68_03370 [Verrucomicrobiota bacterium]